ncbi:MAG: SpoIIE family protein phosphatase, partial [Proteobacteria bacterium]|nr:SpoIIE family protein phosphatase [Pseudomonadota bacterium]
LHKVNGDKQSIGYKESVDGFEFRSHTIDVDDCCSFYLKTDGFTDQLGGEKRLRFGTDRFKKLILAHHDKPYSDQRKAFIQSLITYQGDNEQMDDITLIGFSL